MTVFALYTVLALASIALMVVVFQPVLARRPMTDGEEMLGVILAIVLVILVLIIVRHQHGLVSLGFIR